MGTRSNIAYELPNGQIREIYCHWDGYRSYNGRVLYEHYNSAELADKLTKLGSISQLLARLEPEPGEDHDFDNPSGDITIAYCRDRGEELMINEYEDFNDWRENGRAEGYAYIFRNGCWWDCTTDRRMVKLTRKNVLKD